MTWDIDLDEHQAETPQAAALAARAIMREAESVANVFTVDSQDGARVVVDLDACTIESAPPIESKFADAIEQIRKILWLNVAKDGDRWNPEWNSETTEYVAGVLEDLGLRPDGDDICDECGASIPDIVVNGESPR